MKNLSPIQGRRLLFLMRITVLQIFIVALTAAICHATDSSGQKVLDRKVTLDVENMEVAKVLAIIKEQTKVNFTYSPKLISSDKKVTLHVKDMPLGDVLQNLLSPYFSFQVFKKHIVLKSIKVASIENLDELFEENTISEVDLLFKVTGTVIDETGTPMPGVNIIEKGTTNGTTTDADGKYTLSVNDEKSTLVFSFIGYQTQEVVVGNRSTIDISMGTDAKSLEEVVVVGYGEQNKHTVTGSVVAVQGAELVKSPSIDLSNSLAGRMPGVSAVQGSGEPGYDGSTIRIRGVNTLGDSGPLVVIDGIPDRDGGLNRLSPQDIETMSVLKDASSAIYGARAANGVILIVTKRGKSGTPKVTYDFNQGWSSLTVIPKMANNVEYANIMNEMPIYKNIPVNEWNAAWTSIQTNGTYTSPTSSQTVNAQYSPADVQKFKDGSDPWGHPNTDWFKDALKSWSPQSRHNFQISGGTDNVKYLASFGYVFQDAAYKNSATYYKQYNLRLNLDTKISKYISNSVGLMLREEDRNFPTQSAGSIFRMLMRGRPTEPEVWPNGLPGPDIENGQNPYVITTNQTGYLKNPTDYIQTNAKFEFTNPWVQGLKFTVSGSFDKTFNRNKMWETPWYLYTWDKVSYEADGVTPKLTKALRSTFTDPRLTQNEYVNTNTNFTFLINYDRTIGTDHTIGLLLGSTRETFEQEWFQAYRRQYISSAVDQMFAGGPFQTVDGAGFNRARLGYYGRLTYNYKEKYLVELIGRRDGSSFFPQSSRFGFFPGAMVGWNISNENFFSDNVKFINFMKIRASYGQMGNDRVVYYNNTTPQDYAFMLAYGLGRYPINSQVATTVTESIVPNPSYTWEVAKNSNIGLEATALNGRLDFAFEYFFNNRDNLLIQNTGLVPGSAGFPSLPPVNAGKVQNAGFEFKVGYKGDISDLKYNVSANAGYAKSKVIYMSDNKDLPDYQKQAGYQINSLVLYQSAGAFKSQEEINANTIDYSAITSSLKPGDMKFEDVNKDGKIDGNDAKNVDKSGYPTFNFGATINLQYRNFDLSILFQGATGAIVRYQTESGDIGNYLKYNYDNRWSIDHPSSTDPRLATRGDTYYTGGNFGNNTYFTLSKNYVRLKNIELGYTVPLQVGSKLGISNLRVYVNALNILTWAANDIFDPEVQPSGTPPTGANSGQYYPPAKVINTGLRLTF